MHNSSTQPFNLLSHHCIWERAPHNGLADITRYRDQWYCIFREGAHHFKGAPGMLQILRSREGEDWEHVASLKEAEYDLRDPHFSEHPDGRLMVVMGGSVFDEEKKTMELNTRVAFSKDGEQWTPTREVIPGEWLWRVTWHEGTAYGCAYSFSEPLKFNSEWILKLYSSRDGVQWESRHLFSIPGCPNETTVRFTDEGEMYALVRRETQDRYSWMGRSSAPYKDWEWEKSESRLGGPNFLIRPDGKLWVGARLNREEDEQEGNVEGVTCLGEWSGRSFVPSLELPSGGDNSYPGMYLHEDQLWVVYYSSHEGKAKVYLARCGLTN